MGDLRKSRELETPDLTQKYFFIFMANTIFVMTGDYIAHE
jgi:hypothetical protein